MKTLEQMQAEGEARRADEAGREEAFRAERRRHLQRIALAGGAIGLVSYLLLLIALRERAWFVLFTPVPGAVAAAIVASSGGGILRGIVANSVAQCAYLIGGFLAGGWALVGAGSFAAAGPLILLFMFIVSWPSVGGLLGYLSERFDEDHLMI